MSLASQVADGFARVAAEIKVVKAAAARAVAWTASTVYPAGALVWQGGQLYRRTAAGTSGAAFDSMAWTQLTGRRQPTFSTPRVGEYFMLGAVSMNAQAFPSGDLWTAYIPLPPGTYDQISWRMYAGSAGSTVRALVYDDDGGAPGALLGNTGIVDGTTTGIVSPTVSLVVAPETTGVWAGTLTQGAPATLPQVEAHRADSYSGPMVTPTANPTHQGLAGFFRTGITSAVPSSFTPGTRQLNLPAARLAFRRSA